MPFDVGFAIGGNINGAYSGGNPDTFTPTNNDARADAGTLVGDLSNGTSVAITTGSGGSQPGDLTVDAGFTLESANGASLALEAAGSIAFQEAFRLTGGPLILVAGAGVNQTAAIAADSLNINATGGVTLTSPSNNFGTLSGLTASADSALTDGAALSVTGTINVGAHALTLSTSAGALTITSGVTAGAATLSAAGAINLISAGSVSAATALYVSAAQASIFAGVVSGAGALYQEGPGTLTLTAADTYGGGTTISAGTLQIGAAGGTSGSITGAVTDNATLEFSRSDTTTFSGAISGTGAIVVDGGGTLTLSNTNTYSGGTTVTGGATLVASTAHNLYGSTALGASAITLDGGALSSDGSTILNSVVLDAGGGVLKFDAAGDQFALADSVTGSGQLTFMGLTPGLEIQFGGAANGGSDTHTGATLLTNNVTVLGVVSLSSTSAIQIDSGSTLSAYGDQTLGSLSGAGSVDAAQGARTVTTGGLGIDSTFSGVISNGGGTFAFTKTGEGTQILTGASTYTGATTVNGGALVVDGSITSAVTVNNGATLGGHGTVASVSVAMGGILSPGDYTGGASTIGQLHTGAITLASGAHFAEQLGGAMSFDQMTAAGNVALGGASLDLTTLNGFMPTNGSSFDILHLTSGTLSGQFSQGSMVTANGYAYEITYTSTDVMLSYTVPAPPAPPAPSGPPAESHVLTSGADYYQAGNGGELIYGEGGSDTIIGGAGNDTISAGDYNGSYAGASYDHTLLEGGTGADSIVGGHGCDMIYGGMGNDHLSLIFGGQGASLYGGQGDDTIDASQNNAANYLSGDIGNDLLITGAGSDTVLGGQGDDTIVGSTTAAVGTLQALFGNQGADHISYAAAGSVLMFGGQDGDTLSITTSGQGQMHYAFGNLGDDTLTTSGGYNNLYGGQGNDVVSAAGDSAGHNYLSGDIGDDTITASAGGADTLHGGPGADMLTLTAHPSTAGDTVLIGAGDSTAAQGAGETNLDHIAGFNFASDHIVVAGHAAGTAANVTAYQDATANASEASAFNSAYLYAYGDGTAAHAAHVGATEYLAVAESYGGTNAVYVFTADHTAVVFTGVTASSFQAAAIVGG